MHFNIVLVLFFLFLIKGVKSLDDGDHVADIKVFCPKGTDIPSINYTYKITYLKRYNYRTEFGGSYYYKTHSEKRESRYIDGCILFNGEHFYIEVDSSLQVCFGEESNRVASRCDMKMEHCAIPAYNCN